jgi:hypothetical protein
MALSLAALGYTTALYRDSDDPLTQAQELSLDTAGIPVFEYGSGIYTEQAIFSAASDSRVQELLQYARDERGNDAINSNLVNHLGDLDLATINKDFSEWLSCTKRSGVELRDSISEIASAKVFKDKKNKKPWFKDQHLGRGLSPIVGKIVSENFLSPLALTLGRAEEWLYA